jgi:hypothetical protein
MNWDRIGESLVRYYGRIVPARAPRDRLAKTNDMYLTQKDVTPVEIAAPRARARRGDEHRSDFSQHIGC